MISITPLSSLCRPVLLQLGFRLVCDQTGLLGLDIEDKEHKTSSLYLVEHSEKVGWSRKYLYSAFRINSFSKRDTEVAYYDNLSLYTVKDLNKFLRYLNSMAGF
jgi:hypothetical protein